LDWVSVNLFLFWHFKQIYQNKFYIKEHCLLFITLTGDEQAFHIWSYVVRAGLFVMALILVVIKPHYKSYNCCNWNRITVPFYYFSHKHPTIILLIMNDAGCMDSLLSI
jgi:hypothetical protein